ncbi:MAG TPA: ANTAR domain-containing protein [Hungateiclostridium thermocellum]|uniref:ANTAR domain protein n=1 Tax=Acetivibrio thermocellus (strain ATCC 27405 / DSM 1237 / JCM 9322 / NBRC 103400 / NCIMB 10682 / NRRL B-4536 / VPI 7372) TaxID=203119 RepID=A3DBW5_ACET2|nr:ANTAR domain-containing protein [Acetivibrio thermocellus]ABN51444.1 ANTAR domain protein [Acetivibrio thermocellus ATCC 27405]HBW25958.1 ANTAR domain-containing protein [Acetivibrio thermocellus]
MDSILIVSSSLKVSSTLEELLKFNSSYNEIVMARNAGEAKRILLDRDFDLCIINTPLTDEFGTNLAINIANRETSQVMLIVKSELEDEISDKVEDYGIFVVAKPVNRQLFWSALKLISVSHNRMKGLKKQNEQLQKKIEDIKFVDRAKCVLIEYLKMSEAEAHRFIEKQAMDLRVTKREIASRILKTYEK